MKIWITYKRKDGTESGCYRRAESIHKAMENFEIERPYFEIISAVESYEIDVCDVVHHVPSGENWVVACVDGDRLYWVGYPYGGSAALSDCQLVTKASSEDRQKLLVKLGGLTGFDVPTLRARARLTQRVPDAAKWSGHYDTCPANQGGTCTCSY